jgi:riboflavin synthase
VFTGLIQALGRLQTTGDYQLQISCDDAALLQDLVIGDSVAVDGVCLTVETILAEGFIAAASPETLSRTTLNQQSHRGAWVNLETSLRVGGKVGGHFVTGHVDGIGYLQALEQTATSWELSFTAESGVARYIVLKGSIAVNGISLTIAECNAEGSWFKVAVIPHSFAMTNLRLLQPGSQVNLEGDLLGKYAEKILRQGDHLHREHSSGMAEADLTPAFLAEHGFL